ncbi:MAG: hypothetical protein ACR2MP_32360 [Streptosporangiaceae bacterium]
MKWEHALLATAGTCPAVLARLLRETILFPGTVRDNIAYGQPRAAEQQILAAARAADAHEFVTALPGDMAPTLASAAVCCPAASASGSASPGPSSGTRQYSFWTSPRPGWTRQPPAAS